MISANRSSGSKTTEAQRHKKRPPSRSDGGLFCVSVLLWLSSLVPGNLEFPLLITNSPGAGDELIVCADILELAVNDVVHHLAGRIFYVGFEVEHPRIHRLADIIDWCCLQRQFLQSGVIGARIQHTRQGFPVPVEVQQDSIFVALLEPPLPTPGTFQGMSKLSD